MNNQAKQITVQGQKIGKFRASFLLFKETWRFLKLEPEILFIPIISGLFQLVLLTLVVGTVLLVHFSGTPLIETVFTGDGGVTFAFTQDVVFWVLLFLVYIIFSFTLALSQGAIAHTVMTRLYGGNATLGQALRAALSKAAPLFVWSVINATVGVILQYIVERSKLLGRLVAYFVGVAWSVLTYFVPPAIVVDGQGGVEAVSKSAKILKANFGETVISNIGLGIVFFIINLLFFLVAIGSFVVLFIVSDSMIAFVVLAVILFVLFIFLALLQGALQAILKTLLYAYVMKHSQTPDFNIELLSQVLVRKEGVNFQKQSVETNHGTNNY